MNFNNFLNLPDYLSEVMRVFKWNKTQLAWRLKIETKLLMRILSGKENLTIEMFQKLLPWLKRKGDTITLQFAIDKGFVSEEKQLPAVIEKKEEPIFNLSELQPIFFQNEYWWIASKMAEMGGVLNPSVSVSQFISSEDPMENKDFKVLKNKELQEFKEAVNPGLTSNKISNLTIFSESGLYLFWMWSKCPYGKILRRKIADEILPSIRKTGKYEINSPIQSYLDMSEEDKAIAYFQNIKALKLEAEARKAIEIKFIIVEEEKAVLNQQIEEAQPKLEIYDDIIDKGNEWKTCGEVSKMFCAKDKQGSLMGRNKFCKFLLDKKQMFKSKRTNGYEPYQVYVPKFYKSDIDERNHISVLINTKGIIHIAELLKKEGYTLLANLRVKQEKNQMRFNVDDVIEEAERIIENGRK